MKEPEAADLFLHPVRMRILLALAGRQCTPKMLSSALSDVPHATLYRHIAQLAKAGAIEVVSEEKKRGQTERTYALANAGVLDVETSFFEAGKEERLKYFLSFVTSMLQDFALFLDREDALKRRDFGFHAVVLNLSDGELTQLSSDLRKLYEPYLKLKLTKHRSARTVSSVVIPRPEMDAD